MKETIEALNQTNGTHIVLYIILVWVSLYYLGLPLIKWVEFYNKRKAREKKYYYQMISGTDTNKSNNPILSDSNINTQNDGKQLLTDETKKS